MAKQDEEHEIRELVDASQEVVREAIDAVIRVAKERGISPHRLLRTSFHSLAGYAFTTLGTGPPPPPKRKPSKKS